MEDNLISFIMISATLLLIAFLITAYIAFKKIDKNKK